MTTTDHHAAVNGLELYDEVHGDGFADDRLPLVLLHGGLLTTDIERDPTLTAMSGDVVALLDHLGVERANVFGFSLGGPVALQTAITHPTRVARPVLAGVQMRPDGYHHDVLDPASHPDSTPRPDL